MYLKLCLIIVLAFFYYSSNAHDDYENDDDDQSVTKSTNPKKCDVTQGQSDVTKSENPKKRDVIQGKKGRKNMMVSRQIRNVMKAWKVQLAMISMM